MSRTIKIEITASKDAVEIIVDGQTYKATTPEEWLYQVEPKLRESTLGEIIVREIGDIAWPLMKILRKHRSWETWKPLSDAAWEKAENYF